MFRIACIVAIFLSGSLAAHSDHDPEKDFLKIYKDVDVTLEDQSIIMTCRYDQTEFLEITEDYELLLNGEKLSLNREQRRLVAEYYDLLFDILEYAKIIGIDGARIGVAGAKIGLKALVGVMKVLLTDYESEELEDELEIEGEELEEMARDLEDRAEDLKHLSSLLEKKHLQMREEIPQLKKLDWF